MMKFGIDKTQMIALGLALLFILFAFKQVSGYVQTESIVQGPSDVDMSLYNSRVSQYNKTWASWLSGIISPSTLK
jgi:hypothetical protein